METNPTEFFLVDSGASNQEASKWRAPIAALMKYGSTADKDALEAAMQAEAVKRIHSDVVQRLVGDVPDLSPIYDPWYRLVPTPPSGTAAATTGLSQGAIFGGGNNGLAQQQAQGYAAQPKNHAAEHKPESAPNIAAWTWEERRRESIQAEQKAAQANIQLQQQAALVQQQAALVKQMKQETAMQAERQVRKDMREDMREEMREHKKRTRSMRKPSKATWVDKLLGLGDL
jgi:uncharacterized protein with von Willebrand factor type A (vWA) domain